MKAFVRPAKIASGAPKSSANARLRERQPRHRLGARPKANEGVETVHAQLVEKAWTAFFGHPAITYLGHRPPPRSGITVLPVQPTVGAYSTVETTAPRKVNMHAGHRDRGVRCPPR